jgi:hypothetical protein
VQLAERIRKAREQRVPVGDVTFIVRRPTDLDMMEMGRRVEARRLIPFVIGWEGVTEGHLLKGGDPHPLPFDATACAEWLADRPDLLEAVVTAALESYKAHAEHLTAEKKG